MSENEMKIPKIKLGNMIKHFCTITRHRLLVCKHCFKLGLYWHGLTHDCQSTVRRNSGLESAITRGIEAPMRQSVR